MCDNNTHQELDNTSPLISTHGDDPQQQVTVKKLHETKASRLGQVMSR